MLRTQPVSEYQSAPFGGPFGIRARLLDAVAATPVEGLWIPSGWAKTGSIEAFGSISTLEIDVFGTNALGWPLNTYTATIGGTSTPGDLVGLDFINPNLPNGSKTLTHTVVSGDSLTSIAAALVTKINADAGMQAVQITATNLAGAITIQFPSAVFPGTPSSPPNANTTLLTGVLNSGANESVTIAAGTDGVLLAPITELGLTQVSITTAYIKARLKTLTGGGAVVSAIYNGAA